MYTCYYCGDEVGMQCLTVELDGDTLYFCDTSCKLCQYLDDCFEDGGE